MNLTGFRYCIREEVKDLHMNPHSGVVQIHGKDYITVAKRVELARDEKALESVVTEVLNHNPVVVKATLVIKGRVFTGISSVNTNSQKQIEKQNPYEVAETSAVGRALGFAGYGLIESIASADEMAKAQVAQKPHTDLTCSVCGAAAFEKKGMTKSGKPYHGIFCSTEDKTHTKWQPIVN